MGIAEILERAQELILDAASGWWTLLGLFGMAMGDGFFPVLPSDALVVGLGSVQGEPGTPHWVWIILVAAAGALVGDFIAYHLGRIIGTGRFKWMRRPTVQRTMLWARHELDKRGVLVIFAGRFIPGARVAINFVAGSTSYSMGRFLLIDGAASLVWAGWLTGLGIAGTAIFDNVFIAMPVGIAVAVALGWVFERIFGKLTTWMDQRGYRMDPAGYQDISDAHIDHPLQRRRHHEDGEEAEGK